MRIGNMTVKEVYDLLRAQDSPFYGHDIFMYEVPENFRKREKLPIVRISEIDSFQSRFTSDKSEQFTTMIQIDLWETDIESINAIYFDLNDYLEQYGYKNNMGGVDNDPDFNGTLRMYKRYRITKYK